MSLFEIESHTSLMKSFVVTGPGDLVMTVDYDDVDREQVDETVETMVNLLNNLDGHFL